MRTPKKFAHDLLQHEVIVEKISGEVPGRRGFAISGQGLDELVEAIALQAEILELHANPGRAAQGAFIGGPARRGQGSGGDRAS